MQQSDQHLVAEAARGNERAFHELVDRYAGDLFRLAWSFTGNVHDAEDLTQECFAAAFEGLSRFEGRASVKTWLIRILFKRIARYHRYHQLRRTLPLGGAAEPGAHARQSPEPAASSTNPAGRLDLSGILATLTPDHRDVIVLREIEGFSYAEIADVLGIPAGTVESRLHRARNEIRTRFRDYFQR